MRFRSGTVHDVLVRPITRHADGRGWLCELFRQDEIPPSSMPVMAYVSQTDPGVARGPHAHWDQSDYFCFLGPSDFTLYLWDTRPSSPSYEIKQVENVGESRPVAVIIPPGVVHAYRNDGQRAGLVFNAPNRLYRGQGRQHEVDEIRYEDHSSSVYLID